MICIENGDVTFKGDDESLVIEVCEIIKAVYDISDHVTRFLLTAYILGTLQKESKEHYADIEKEKKYDTLRT